MKTREWLLLEALSVVNRVLRNTTPIVMKTNIRKPTTKEERRHPKLLRKQRARFGGI